MLTWITLEGPGPGWRVASVTSTGCCLCQAYWSHCHGPIPPPTRSARGKKILSVVDILSSPLNPCPVGGEGRVGLERHNQFAVSLQRVTFPGQAQPGEQQRKDLFFTVPGLDTNQHQQHISLSRTTLKSSPYCDVAAIYRWQREIRKVSDWK